MKKYMMKNEDVSVFGVKQTILAALIIISVICTSLSTASAQRETLSITSPYVHLYVERPTELFLPLNLTNLGRSESIKLSVESPENWTASITYDGYKVKEINVPTGKSVKLKLRLSIPSDAQQGKYTVKAIASSSDDLAKSTVSFTIEYVAPPMVEPEVVLTSAYPSLSGPTGTKFEFTVNVRNKGGEDEVFTLLASPPPEWTVTFTPQYESKQISSLSIKGGESKTITVAINPPARVEPGNYTIPLKAISATASGDLTLSVVVTGTFAATLTTVDERLSAEAVSGEETYITLVVKNTGTSELEDISLSSSHPSGWALTFDPNRIPSLAPGASQQVSVTFKPAAATLPGDYIVSLSMYGGRVSKTIDIRVTVTAPLGLAIIGIGVVAAVAIALAAIFLRFGRR